MIEISPPHHPDDIAVNAFAEAMRAKLKLSREIKGRGGWQNTDSVKLREMMIEHISKGDMVDVANFAMMIWHNNQQKPFHHVPTIDEEVARLRAAVFMVGNNDTPEDKASWWETFGDLWERCATRDSQEKANQMSLARYELALKSHP